MSIENKKSIIEKHFINALSKCENKNPDSFVSKSIESFNNIESLLLEEEDDVKILKWKISGEINNGICVVEFTYKGSRHAHVFPFVTKSYFNPLREEYDLCKTESEKSKVMESIFQVISEMFTNYEFNLSRFKIIIDQAFVGLIDDKKIIIKETYDYVIIFLSGRAFKVFNKGHKV